MQAQADSRLSESEVDPSKKSPNNDYAGSINLDNPFKTVADQPTEKDHLGREIYAKALASLISFRDTITPFNIGLLAEWGEGKTSLMKLVEKEINHFNAQKRPARIPVSVVWFNAWKFDTQDQIWSNLLLSLADAFEKEEGWFKVKWAFFRANINNYLWTLGIGVSVLIALIIYFFFPGLLPVLIKPVTENNESSWYKVVPASLIAIFTLFTSIRSLIKAASNPFTNIIKRFVDTTALPLQVTCRDQVEQALAIILDSWLDRECNLGKGSVGELHSKSEVYSENKRLLLMVDDLDRCKIESIMQLLDSLQIFLNSRGIISIIGIDYRIAATAIQVRFSSFFDSSADRFDKLGFAYNYIEKIINLPFRLPKLNVYQLSKYLDSLLVNEKVLNNKHQNYNLPKSANKEDLAIELSEEEINAIRSSCILFRDSPNPRRIKLFLNTIRIASYLYQSKELDFSYSKAETHTLIHWLAISMIWPDLSFELVNKCLDIEKSNKSTRSNKLALEVSKELEYTCLSKLANGSIELNDKNKLAKFEEALDRPHRLNSAQIARFSEISNHFSLPY